MKIGFLSDAHGNVEAASRGLRVLEQHGVDQIYFLGDAVGYIPGIDVLSFLRTNAIPCLKGNHEVMLQSPAADREDVYQVGLTAAAMSEDLREWVAGWPAYRRLEFANADILLVHGSPRDPTFEYVYPDCDLDQFERPCGTVTVMGHTHRPFIRKASSGALFVNAGSCGLPRDAGDLGSAAILDLTNNEARILRFAIGDASRGAVRRAGRVHDRVTRLFGRPRPEQLEGMIVAE